jgi:peptide/nickel transport system permease protein
MYSLRGGGGLADPLLHLLLPTVTTAAAPGAIIARMTRASVVEILGQDFIKVARAKGLHERVVIGAHALRVAAPPIVTICGLQVGYLLGGAVFTEEVFGWPGLGRQLVSSVIARDIQVVQGVVLFIALSFVLVNLVVDLANLMLDPRTRVG